jgi:signal transduction histidine kinase
MAIAAHDLKAPLAGMRNLLQMVRLRRKLMSDEAAARVLDEMENTTDGMLNLVSSLLVAKRAEELDAHLTLISCDSVELLGRMTQMHRQVASAKGITFEVEAPQEILIVTHPESFCQIVSNLLSNAVNFSPEKGVIQIELGTDAVQKRLILQVDDDGPGIPPDEVATIFDKFRRADNQPVGGQPSHGIGLFIVDKLSAALGGEVKYRPRPEGGARFTVTLPLKNRPADVD